MRLLQRRKLHGLQKLMGDPLVIGTRGSPLALRQAEAVREAIERRWPGLEVRLEIIRTQGDRFLDAPLAAVGGKGLFVKEIEESLLAGRADLAVHSLKDVPAETAAGLTFGAIPARENPCDALVSRRGERLAELPPGSRVGTSSLRRAAQLRRLRPDLELLPVRGNVETRLRKLESGDLDAVVLAAAGLNRLGLAARICERFEPERLLPAVGQGALCVQIREGDPRTAERVAPLDHAPTRTVVAAERAFLQRIGGGCQVPIAGFAVLEGEAIELRGLVADLNGERLVSGAIRGHAGRAQELGAALAEELLERGAADILAALGAKGRP
ncbi:MAG: hydroxymethylbilane synthase [Desulfobacterales bacterium]